MASRPHTPINHGQMLLILFLRVAALLAPAEGRRGAATASTVEGAGVILLAALVSLAKN